MIVTVTQEFLPGEMRKFPIPFHHIIGHQDDSLSRLTPMGTSPYTCNLIIMASIPITSRPAEEIRRIYVWGCFTFRFSRNGIITPSKGFGGAIVFE